MRCLGGALVALLLALAAPARAQEAPLVAAASDLNFALAEIAEGFRRDSGQAVRLAFGSSGNFARQILQGAPFELFLSADESFVFALADQGRALDRGVLYAIGRIALFAPAGSPLQIEAGLEGLRAALAAGALRRFAIANPEHAPYGRAAAEALRGAGLWEAIQPLLVLGENVSQAAQFTTSGAAQGGIIAYSLALAPSIGERGRYTLIPASAHAPLNQRMVLLRQAGATAKAFYAHMQGAAARAVLGRHGFTVPGEG